jgi:hypothetical protein
MNDIQEAKLSMYQEVANICHANEQMYAGVLAMNNAVFRLDEGVSGILQATGQQSGMMPQGATADKIHALDAMTTVALQTANALYVYAIDSGNSDLLVQVGKQKHVLQRTRERYAGACVQHFRRRTVGVANTQANAQNNKRAIFSPILRHRSTEKLILNN